MQHTESENDAACSEAEALEDLVSTNIADIGVSHHRTDDPEEGRIMRQLP